MAELYEIAFAIESQRESIARAATGAVHERQEHAREVQARQERRRRRERLAFRQDKGLDALKHARQSGAGNLGAGWKPFAMKASAAARKSLALSREAMAIAREWEATAASRIQAGTHDGPDRSRSSAGHRTPSRLAAAAGHAFWTWLVPAAGVLAGILAMLAVLLAACFLL